MQKALQFAVGCAAMFLAAPFLHETPFNHWMVFLPLFMGSMYATAVLQALFHFRFSRRGALTAKPGASEYGRARGP